MNQPEPQIEPELVEQFATEFAVNQETALEMLQWMDERLCNVGGLDEAIKVQEVFRYALKQLISMQNRLHHVNEVRMSTAALCLALGFDNAADVKNSVELGKKYGFERAAANNHLNEFIGILKIGKLPNQRSSASRKKMSEAQTPKTKDDN